VVDPSPAGARDTGPSLRFQNELRAGRLAYQRCTGCSSAVFPPRVLCPVCSTGVLAWEVSSGAGTVYSASTLTPRDRQSYTVVLVDLDEGFRVMSVVAGPHAPLGGRVRVRAHVPDDPAGEPRLLTLVEASGG